MKKFFCIKRMIDRYNNMSIMARASLWAFASGLIQKGVSVLATPIFTRILNTEEYAQFSIYQSWQDIFIIFVSMNVFNYATYTAMAKFENDRDSFIGSAQMLVTVLSAVCLGIYSILHFFNGEIIDFPMGIVILMFVDMLFISSYNLWFAKKRYEYQYQIMTAISVLLGIGRPLLGIVLIRFTGFKPGYGRIYGYAVVNILIGFFIYLADFKKYVNFAYWKYIFTFCIPLIPHFLSSKILDRFDRIMINKMCSSVDVAIYSLAYSLSTLMLIVSDAILSSVTPWTYQCMKEEKYEKIGRTVNLTLLLVAGSNLILILFAPEAVRIFAPSEYYPAIYIIPSVSASVYFMFLFNVFANIEYYYSETKYVAFASIAAAVLNVILNYIFIDAFGYIAAGYTTLISYILYSLGHYLFMKKVCKKHAGGYSFYDEKTILVISIAFTIIALTAVTTYGMIIFRYVLIMLLLFTAFYKRREILLLIKRKQ